MPPPKKNSTTTSTTTTTTSTSTSSNGNTAAAPPPPAQRHHATATHRCPVLVRQQADDGPRSARAPPLKLEQALSRHQRLLQQGGG
jgi:hypothetical protein